MCRKGAWAELTAKVTFMVGIQSRMSIKIIKFLFFQNRSKDYVKAQDVPCVFSVMRRLAYGSLLLTQLRAARRVGKMLILTRLRE